MKDIFKKFNRQIAILLGVTLIVPLLVYSTQGIVSKAVVQDKSEDERIAAEVSNMTGIAITEIMELREQNKSWNEILEIFKANDGAENEDERSKRSELLARTGFDKSVIEELLNEFDNDEVMEAKLLVERLIFQLTEITNYKSVDDINPSKPNIEVHSPSQEESIEIYTKLLEAINQDMAIYLILELQEEFGSLEDALDEYLLALQLELKLENYSKDRDEYLRNKEEKKLSIVGELITLAKIEEKMLEEIYKQNNKDINQLNIPTEETEVDDQKADMEDTIESPIPKINDVKPINPTDAIEEELRIINPN